MCGTSYIPNLGVITQGSLTFFYMLQSVWLSHANLPHKLFYISLLFFAHTRFSGLLTGGEAPPVQKQRLCALRPVAGWEWPLWRGAKRWVLRHPYACTGCSDVYIHFFFLIVQLFRVISVSIKIYTRSQCLHMEVIKPGQLCKQTFFTTSLRFSVSTVKHDLLCWSRAEQSWAAC